MSGSKPPRIILTIALVLIASAGIAYSLDRLIASRAEPTPSGQTSTPAETPTPEPPTPTPDTATCIADLPVDVAIGQKIMIAGYSGQIATLMPLLAKYHIGGVILMNEVSRASIADMQRSAPIPLLVATDQEGGTVQRYKSAGAMLGASDMAAQKSPAEARDIYGKDAKYLASLGITTNFAPDVDVYDGVHDPLPGRMYSSDPSVVESYATAAITASQSAGVTSVIKHFPGLGTASGNTDFGSATTAPLSTLEPRDIAIYRDLAPLHPDAMVSNAITPGLTDGQPATLSPPAVSLLRSFGYQDSVIYSDSLTARAVPGTLDQAALKAWQAGIDIALIVQESQQIGQLASYLDSIFATGRAAISSGELNSDSLHDSLARILARKSIEPCSISS